jgi:hypothetical protein
LHTKLVTGCWLKGSKLDADRPPPAPNNLAASGDGLRHSGKPEHGTDRGGDVCHKLRTVGGYIQDLAFVAFDAAVEGDPRPMLPRSAD